MSYCACLLWTVQNRAESPVHEIPDPSHPDDVSVTSGFRLRLSSQVIAVILMFTKPPLLDMKAHGFDGVSVNVDSLAFQ